MTFDNKQDIHLRYEDIIPYLPPDPDGLTPEMIDYTQKWKEKTHRHYVDQVNKLYDDFLAIWPTGTAIEFYIAFSHFSSKSDIEIFEKLENPKVIQEILKIEASIKSKQKESTSDAESLNIKPKKKLMRKKQQWSEEETHDFIKLFSSSNDCKNWKDVSKKFKSKTPEDCYILFNKLHVKNKLTKKYAPKRSPRLKTEEEIFANDPLFQGIKGLFFEYKEIRAIVGPGLESRKEMAKESPLYGHTDLITGERMFLPTISEYGTVLDYSSWLKIISDTHLDPYEIKPIVNARQITIVTKDNYEEIKPRIKNIGEKIST